MESYDLVVIDTPPPLRVAYASTLVRHADVVLVVAPRGGSITAYQDLRDRLKLTGTPTIGYVYTKAPLRSEMTRSEGSLKEPTGIRRGLAR